MQRLRDPKVNPMKPKPPPSPYLECRREILDEQLARYGLKCLKDYDERPWASAELLIERMTTDDGYSRHDAMKFVLDATRERFRDRIGHDTFMR